jgi:hypothetical protein
VYSRVVSDPSIRTPEVLHFSSAKMPLTSVPRGESVAASTPVAGPLMRSDRQALSQSTSGLLESKALSNIIAVYFIVVVLRSGS